MKKILSIFFILALMFVNVKVYAKDFSKSENVSVKKEWTVKFTKDVKNSSVNQNNIWVEDGNKNKFPVDYKVNGKYVTIIPKTPYNYETSYKIMIDKNVLSVNGDTLKNQIIKEFVTEKSTDSSQYDLVTTWEGYKKPYGYKFTANTDIDYSSGTGIFIYIGSEDDASKIPENAIYNRNKCMYTVSDVNNAKTMFKKGDFIISAYLDFREFEGQNVYYKTVKGVKTHYGEVIVDQNAVSTEWKYCGKMPHKDNVDKESKVSAYMDLENPENKNCINVFNDNSKKMDLTGWYIEVGDSWGINRVDKYYFTEGTVIDSNKSLKILLNPTENTNIKYDLLWKTDKQLNYGDMVILHNAKGEIVQNYCDGIEE